MIIRWTLPLTKIATKKLGLARVDPVECYSLFEMTKSHLQSLKKIISPFNLFERVSTLHTVKNILKSYYKNYLLKKSGLKLNQIKTEEMGSQLEVGVKLTQI